jgi:methylmalonyl-CoA mutase cobalamin-binding subunit
MVVASTPSGARRRAQPAPLRLLTAVPVCDGHDSAVTTVNLELARHGAEVIYLGYHCAASAIARAAVQEDVHAVGLSSYNGGHRAFFREVLAQARAGGVRHPRLRRRRRDDHGRRRARDEAGRRRPDLLRGNAA